MIDLPAYLKLAHITYNCMCEQERTGICFDTPKAIDLIKEITDKMEDIVAEIEPQLPKRQPNKGEQKKMTPPKEQFKKDGTPNVYCLRWFDEVWIPPGQVDYFGRKGGMNYKLPWHEPIIELQEMKLSNQAELKQWFLSMKWKPEFWNFKTEKGPGGKLVKVRDIHGRLVKTSPKLQENGKICPGLSRLGEANQLIRPILTWMTLRHRRSQIQGWVNNPRLEIDGRLPAGSSGLTNTGRQKHKTVANIPRVTTVYGPEMRGLFIASEGKTFVGYDASGLEARVKGHYTAKYDDGEYAKKILSNDYDEHEENAELWDCERKDAKTPGYALQYFCGLKTFCKALDVKEAQGAELYDKYWDTNWALKMVDEAVARAWNNNDKKYILTIDRSKKYTRSRHSITNTLFQSTGAKIMDMSWAFMRKYLKDANIPYKRVVYYHDEYIIECNPEHAEQIGQLAVKSIVKAGEYFKLKVPLDAEYKIGHSWAEVH